MIFLTVGTDHHQFIRLLKEIDRLITAGSIQEEVFGQIGPSAFTPPSYAHKNFLTLDEMHEYARKARIIITHGGPGTILLALEHGKIPIVVPRLREHREVVDDHQVSFTRIMEQQKKVVAVYDLKLLGAAIRGYDAAVAGLGFKLDEYTKESRLKLKVFTDELDRISNTLVQR